MLVKILVYMAHSSATLAMYKISWEIYSHLDLGHSGKVISPFVFGQYNMQAHAT